MKALVMQILFYCFVIILGCVYYSHKNSKNRANKQSVIHNYNIRSGSSFKPTDFTKSKARVGLASKDVSSYDFLLKQLGHQCMLTATERGILLLTYRRGTLKSYKIMPYSRIKNYYIVANYATSSGTEDTPSVTTLYYQLLILLDNGSITFEVLPLSNISEKIFASLTKYAPNKELLPKIKLNSAQRREYRNDSTTLGKLLRTKQTKHGKRVRSSVHNQIIKYDLNAYRRIFL